MNSQVIKVLNKKEIVYLENLKYNNSGIMIKSKELLEEVKLKYQVEFTCKDYKELYLVYKRDSKFTYFLALKNKTLSEGKVKWHVTA